MFCANKGQVERCWFTWTETVTYNAGHLLHELDAQGQAESFVRLYAVRFEEIGPSAFFGGFDADGFLDIVPFRLHGRVAHGLAAKSSQHRHPFLLRVVSHQPTRSIRQERRDGDDVNGKYELEEQRKPPLRSILVEIEAVIDPVRQHQTEEHGGQLAAHLPTPLGRFADLTLIHWRDRCDVTDPDSRQDASDHELHPLVRAAH